MLRFLITKGDKIPGQARDGFHRCALQAGLLGNNSVLDPPDPIPNSEVKRNSADDSVGSPHVKVGHCQALIQKPRSLIRSGLFLFSILYKIRFGAVLIKLLRAEICGGTRKIKQPARPMQTARVLVHVELQTCACTKLIEIIHLGSWSWYERFFVPEPLLSGGQTESVR